MTTEHNVSKSPFDGTPGTSDAAGGSWGNSGGSSPHSERLRQVLHEVVGFDRAGSLVGHPYERTYHVIAQHAEEAFASLHGLEEQFEALRLAATRQLTPLDVAATHIDILRRKSEDYTPQERDNVAAIVESHVKEARTALFAAISNPASEPKP